MKIFKASVILVALALVIGCEKGPPADNSNVKTPPKPAPPGSPG